MKETGFKKQIIAFEPVKNCYLKTKKNLSNYSSIKVENIGIGNFTGKTKMNIASNNNLSSSILDFKKHPSYEKIREEEIQVVTLTNYLNKNKLDKKNIFLKLDVQGYEFNILKAIENFENIKVIQLEMALISFYDKERLFPEVFKFMNNLGYKIVLISDLGQNKNGETNYIDVMFKQNN